MAVGDRRGQWASCQACAQRSAPSCQRDARYAWPGPRRDGAVGPGGGDAVRGDAGRADTSTASAVTGSPSGAAEAW